MGNKRSRIVLPPAEYRELREKTVERDQNRCRCCRRRQMLHSHHLTYRSHGGDDAEYNIATLCDPCHEAVHERYLLIEPMSGTELNGNEPLRFVALNGWKPGEWVPTTKRKNSKRKKAA